MRRIVHMLRPTASARRPAKPGFLLYIGSLLALACGESVPPPKMAPPPPPPPSAEEVAAAAAAEATPAVLYVYTPIGKRDPFRNELGVTAVTPVNIPGGRKPTELQKWDIDQLVLRSTITGTSTPWALIEDPEGKGHSVNIGDFVGKHWGKVTSIRRGEITVTETIQDRSTGRVYPVHIPMRVPKESGGVDIDEVIKEMQEKSRGG
jgi:type IV pilus assembly protein PilP